MELPIFYPRYLTHIGTLKKETPRHGGFEGLSLSVSLHPKAWRQIARLGGYPLWQLQKPNIKLLDLHRLRRSQKLALLAESENLGLIERTHAWKLTVWDEEGEGGYCMYSTYEEALAELPDLQEAKNLIKKTPIWKATPELTAITGPILNGLGIGAEDMALIQQAERHNLDGVWWREALDPLNLSAPRGCIVQTRLPSFQVDELNWDHSDDEILWKRAQKTIKILA